jgi:ethanolamine utilization protein EutM
VEKENSCLGVIETESLASALEAADTMLKLKTVTLFKLIFIGCGRTAVLVQGETGAVQAAVEAGAKAAERKGKVLARNVIPRCDPSLINFLADVNSREASVDQNVQVIRSNGSSKQYLKYVIGGVVRPGLR